MSRLYPPNRTTIHSATVNTVDHFRIDHQGDIPPWVINHSGKRWDDAGCSDHRARTYWAQRGWTLHYMGGDGRGQRDPLPYSSALICGIAPIRAALTFSPAPTRSRPDAIQHWIELFYAGNDPEWYDRDRHMMLCGTRSLASAWTVFEQFTLTQVPSWQRHELLRAAGYWLQRRKPLTCPHCGKSYDDPADPSTR